MSIEELSFQTEAALINDAIKVFSKAFEVNETFIGGFKMNPSSCYDINSNPDTSSTGKDILRHIDMVVRFDLIVW